MTLVIDCHGHYTTIGPLAVAKWIPGEMDDTRPFMTEVDLGLAYTVVVVFARPFAHLFIAR